MTTWFCSEIATNSSILSFLSHIADFLTIIGVGGIGGIIVLLYKKRRAIFDFFTQQRIRVVSSGYYSDIFLLKNIQKAKNRIVIFCVRNLRVSEADILSAFKKACDRGVNVELYWMDPDINDCIIEEIMQTLPTPAASIGDYKGQVEEHKKIITNEVSRWSQDSQNRLIVFTYRTLPSIHFCCFDNAVYVGFQIYNPNDDLEKDEKLGDFCLKINTSSRLGKLILTQISLLGDRVVKI